MLSLLIAIVVMCLYGQVVLATPVDVGGSDLATDTSSSKVQVLAAQDQNTTVLTGRQIEEERIDDDDELPDRAELVLRRLSWRLGVFQPTSTFYMINEYNGWQLVRQSLCDTGFRRDKDIEQRYLTVCQSSPELKTYEEPHTFESARQAWSDYQVIKQMKGSTLIDTFVLEHSNYGSLLRVRSNGKLSGEISQLFTRSRIERYSPFDPLAHRIFLWTPDRFEAMNGEYYNEGAITPYKPWPKESYLPDTEPIV